MQLIKLYRSSTLSALQYIEGYNKQYRCITLWDDADGLTQSYQPYLIYTSENKICKGTNPFIE